MRHHYYRLLTPCARALVETWLESAAGCASQSMAGFGVLPIKLLGGHSSPRHSESAPQWKHAQLQHVCPPVQAAAGRAPDLVEW